MLAGTQVHPGLIMNGLGNKIIGIMHPGNRPGGSMLITGGLKERVHAMDGISIMTILTNGNLFANAMLRVPLNVLQMAILGKHMVRHNVNINHMTMVVVNLIIQELAIVLLQQITVHGISRVDTALKNKVQIAGR
jgi:hypothetical protein